MKTLLFLLILLSGCATPKQIATCVQTCENINAIVEEYVREDNGVHCFCTRTYLIDGSSTKIEEITR